MDGDEHHPWCDQWVQPDHSQRAAATAGDFNMLALGDINRGGIRRVHLQKWARIALVELRYHSRFGACVPVVERSAGCQDQRILFAGCLMGRKVRPCPELRTAGCCRKTAVNIATLRWLA